MMICKNGPQHKHETVEESRRCWSAKYAGPVAPVAAPPAPIHPRDMPGSISARQKSYINDLGGHWQTDWSYNAASACITDLLARKKQEPKVTDPRLDMISGMLSMVPDGYYATAPQGEGGHVDFLMFKHVEKATKRIPAGTLKIQTQHSEHWMEALVQWPSGTWSVHKPSVIEQVLLVIADYKTCARRYAIEVQACMRCNKTLTDDRSRHYLVGPECETKHGFTWPIAYADEQNDGLSYEALVARGMQTRVWQDKLAA